MKEGAANSVRTAPVNRKAKASGRCKSANFFQDCLPPNLKFAVRSLPANNSLSAMMSKVCS